MSVLHRGEGGRCTEAETQLIGMAMESSPLKHWDGKRRAGEKKKKMEKKMKV